MASPWLRFSGYTAGLLVGLSAVTACATVPTTQEMAGSAELEAPAADMAEPATAAKVTAANGEGALPSQPQLIRRANLLLTVESVDSALEQTAQIVQAQQGSILDLQDQQPEAGRHRSAYLRLQVPQANLEATLTALADLGTVEQRSITAEDVSDQLVDLQARLKNLRQSEAALQKIMERSGSIADVLEVSRELSTVREQIEQLAARQKALQTRVSYSVIELNLESAIATATPGRPLGEKVSNTWQQATQSVGDFTVGLMQIGLWLLAYSPYLAIVAIAAALAYRLRRSGEAQTGRSQVP
ncbi:MAG: DUF4349 domain-containing protein [Leptolyngbya sp. SIO4C1]|nr:DUF4349 domain-containing protein [Leptolyngbya sp. SIO4C1]